VCCCEQQTGLRTADEADSHADPAFPVCRVKAHVARYERLVEVVVASRVAVAVRAKLLLAPHISTRSPSDEESIDISWPPPGPQQQTRSSGVRWPDRTNGQTDKRMDGRTDGRPTVAQILLRIAYYGGSANNQIKSIKAQNPSFI